MNKAKNQKKYDLASITGVMDLEDEVLAVVTGGLADDGCSSCSKPSCHNGGGCSDGGGCDTGGAGGAEIVA